MITIPKNGRIVPSMIPSKAPLGCPENLFPIIYINN